MERKEVEKMGEAMWIQVSNRRKRVESENGKQKKKRKKASKEKRERGKKEISRREKPKQWIQWSE